MGRSVKELENYIQEAIKNIRDDRDVTSTLLTQVFAEITNGQETHKDLGLIAAKYVETLQRSNEQLVKLAALIQKEEKKSDAFSFSSHDKEGLYDMISGNPEEEE